MSNITSPVTNIAYLDNIGIQCNYTSVPNGSLNIQVSADYAQDQEGNVLNAGNWVTIVSLATPSNASPVFFDINQISAPWIRVKYLATSADGFLDVYITGKMV